VRCSVGGLASHAESKALTSSAMSAIGTWAQSLKTVQPASRSARSFLRSRATLASSLVFHHAAFALGLDPWVGHRCQKHPSTNTARRCRGNATSSLQRKPCTGERCLRNRKPRRWSSDRRARSIALSERLPSITLRAVAEDGGGAGGTEGIGGSRAIWSMRIGSDCGSQSSSCCLSGLLGFPKALRGASPAAVGHTQERWVSQLEPMLGFRPLALPVERR